MYMDGLHLRGSPDRIFISVDESSGTSTVSFFPTDVGSPVQRTDDGDGAHAMSMAKAIIAKHPSATIHGPHFHAARPAKARVRKRG